MGVIDHNKTFFLGPFEPDDLTMFSRMKHDMEYTFDNPDSPKAKWGKIDHLTHSYVGHFVYLSNGAKQGFWRRVRGARVCSSGQTKTNNN